LPEKVQSECAMANGQVVAKNKLDSSTTASFRATSAAAISSFNYWANQSRLGRVDLIHVLEFA
jgi:hypothetical protein